MRNVLSSSVIATGRVSCAESKKNFTDIFKPLNTFARLSYTDFIFIHSSKELPPTMPGVFVVHQAWSQLGQGVDTEAVGGDLLQCLDIAAGTSTGAWGSILYENPNSCNLLLTHSHAKGAQRVTVPSFCYPVEESAQGQGKQSPGSPLHLQHLQHATSVQRTGSYFIARMGMLSEVSDAHADFVIKCSEYFNARRCVGLNQNKAGRLLVDLTAATSVANTTGHAPGDYGQLSYVGYYNDRSSKPDHILLSPALYKSAKAFEMFYNFASDYCGLSLVFQGACAGSMSTGTERNHVCKVGLCDNKPILRWNHEKALAQHLVSNAELMSQFEEVESLTAGSWKQKGPLSPVWFDEQKKKRKKKSLRSPEAACIKGRTPNKS
eukprot:1161004-Pelagomonas_calceolata.AAC.4